MINFALPLNKMNKQILPIFFAVAFIACNEDKKPTKTTTNRVDTVQIIKEDQPAEAPTGKERLIAELDKFKLAVETKNKTELAGFFNFPVADSSLMINDINAEFDRQRIENGNKITKDMFNDNFERLYEYWDFEEFKSLFEFLKPSELSGKNKLEYVYRPKNEGCYFMYHIDVKGNEVTMSYGTNTNNEYRDSHPDEAEVCGEYFSAWVFDWNGKKLTFKKQIIAG